MKNLILVIASALMLASCEKQAKQSFAPQKMNGIEFTKKFKFELPYLDYGNSMTVARGKKAKADAIFFNVSEDLTISESAGVVTTSISPDAEWAGVQKFFTIDSTNNGVSVCNWNWSYEPAPSSQTCATNGSGSYRSWSSDKITYDVHLSPFLPL